MTRASRWAVATLLFLSGLTGLVYELCWSKRLSNVLGNSGQAHAVVLATFMGGLAAGAWLFGRTADRARRPLVVYGVLEFGVGVYALLFPWVTHALEAAYVGVAPGLDGAAKTIARLVLAGAALLPPTLLMGGSLPAMTRFVTRGMGSARSELSWLYAVNSLGAALGCLFAGMVLVPDNGIVATERMAAALNLALGVAALAFGVRVAPSEELADVPGEAPAITYSALAVRMALIGTALAGFTSMLYEITWIRLLSIVIGGTSYAFTLILTAFIIGISAGSFWLSRRAESDALATFGWMQLGLVLSVCVALPLYERLPYVFIQLSSVLEHGPQTWPLYQFITFLFCGLVLMPPTFFLGASFPAAARVAMSSVANVGGQLGRVYVWNTFGTVAGSLAGGLWLLPTIGLEGNFLVGIVCNVIAAALAAVVTRERPVARRFTPVVIAAVLVGAFSVSTRGWSQIVVASGRYREWKRTFDSYASFRELVQRRSTIDFYRDDVFASVMVGSQGPTRRFLRINGKVDGSNTSDADTQVLAAHLGVLMHPREVKKVLLVGVGAGITAGSLLAYPIEQLDVVEISPAVIDAAKLFAKDNRDALSDKRCHVHVEDARTFLTLSKDKYDLIVSVPSNPWVSGVSGLFSRDFFQVAKTKLAPEGRIVQWIHTYESSLPMVQLVLRTLRDSFPHATTWVGPDDLVMIGSAEPQTVDVEVMAERMKRPEAADDLAHIHVHDVVTLLARQVHSDAFQAQVAGDGPVNTDDHNLLEYGSPIGYFAAARVKVPDERTGPTQGAGLPLQQWLATHPLTAAQARDLYESFVWVHDDDDSLVRANAKAWLDRDPDSVDAALAVAKVAMAQSNPEIARRALEPLINRGERRPDVVTQWLLIRRAGLRREAGPWNPFDVADDVALGREVAQANPKDVDLQDALEKLEASR